MKTQALIFTAFLLGAAQSIHLHQSKVNASGHKLVELPMCIGAKDEVPLIDGAVQDIPDNATSATCQAKTRTTNPNPKAKKDGKDAEKKDDKKADAKADDKKVDAKAADKKADAKPAEKKDAKAEDKKDAKAAF